MSTSSGPLSRYFHPSSFRYALALWLATVLALLAAFVVQLEPAQWAGITVWIMFVQNPRINYSKIIWWVFGTVVGALMAVVLIMLFNQAPELFLLSLALWLGLCTAAATLVTSYRAYGGVLAGYTCAIVAMSAAERPDMVFNLAVTRVSCIFIGMAAAVLMMTVLLPPHQHWRDTLHHLEEHLKGALAQAARALVPGAPHPVHFTWRYMVDRLSMVEHTLDVTTAESPGSRAHAPQARSLVATLFGLLAKAQSLEVHLSRTGGEGLPEDVKKLLQQTRLLLDETAAAVPPELAECLTKKVAALHEEVLAARKATAGLPLDAAISSRFVLDRLDEMLEETALAMLDWAGLSGPWKARRPVRLAVHLDYPSACIYGLRIMLAIGLASAIWFITAWPAGSQLILFIAVVCSLLSLMPEAPVLGIALLKSAVFCATIAYIDTFWLLQNVEGFPLLALALGLFLVPAAAIYRHRHLHGSAVVSMLIFYGLSNLSNKMNYDVSAFLNNGLALLTATVCGFFCFHAVPSLRPLWKRFWLLHAVRRDLRKAGRGERGLSEQGWTSRMFDRLRLLHQTHGDNEPSDALRAPENDLLVGLQLGLRQRSLRGLLDGGFSIHCARLSPVAARAARKALRRFRRLSNKPEAVVQALHGACTVIPPHEDNLGLLAELREMAFLIESPSPLYID